MVDGGCFADSEGLAALADTEFASAGFFSDSEGLSDGERSGLSSTRGSADAGWLVGRGVFGGPDAESLGLAVAGEIANAGRFADGEELGDGVGIADGEGLANREGFGDGLPVADREGFMDGKELAGASESGPAPGVTGDACITL